MPKFTLSTGLFVSGAVGLAVLMAGAQQRKRQTLPRSPQWLNGYKRGAGWIRGRVRGKKQDLSEIEKELQTLDSLRR